MAARRYGRRLRRTAAGTAVAAAAMAALSASQGPGFLSVAHAQSAAQNVEQNAEVPPPGPEIDGGSPYITDLPPLQTPTGPFAPVVPPGQPGTGGGGEVTVPGGGASLPTTVLDAYRRAEATIAESDPDCHLPWQLLAAIGQVESGQARGGRVDANGTTFSPILEPVLNGNGFANISDTDNGRYDGDALHDRAVGPMQFIPSTWNGWGADGNGDGVKDPNNVYDAALAAGHYLCADGRDLAVPADMDRAILGYNHSQAYLNLVRAWYEHYRAGGAVSVPDRSGTPGPGVTPPPLVTKPPTGPTGSPPPSVPSGRTVSPPATPPTGGPTGDPTSPTGDPTTPADPTGDPTSPTDDPTTPADPTDDPTSPTGDPTTPADPTDPPTTPGCPTDPADQTPSDEASTPPPGDPSDPATPDPCATDTPTPMPTDTAGEATGAALVPVA